jgi:hypothetical protein
MLAVLFGCSAVVIAAAWPEKIPLVWALGLLSITMAILSLREPT